MLENWILEGDEQGNFAENAFVFLSIVFGLISCGAKLWMNDRVNMLLSIQKFFPRKKKINPHKLNLQEFKVWSKLLSVNEILVGSCWWMQSCGYAVSNFDLLSELWENTQIQISFKHYSFIVIIFCFFSYKLLIRSTFCMNLMLQWSIFHFVFFIWSWVSS